MSPTIVPQANLAYGRKAMYWSSISERKMKQSVYTGLTVLLLFSLSNCSSIDFEYPRNESFALTDTDETFLGRETTTISQNKPADESGFYPLINGIDALAMRLVLASNAERTIDVQYYLIKDDITGLALVRELLNAADRGVRVRVLVDDVFTSGYDAGLSVLYGHPNFEIRITNPFNRGAMGRIFSSVGNFSRINRRMHNKSFTVDNKVTIIGGRNIADEYFGAREDNNFSDLDVLGIGPIVKDVSAMFDAYWNHPQALPIPAFITPPDDQEEAMTTLRSRLENNISAIRQSRYAEAVSKSMSDYFSGGFDILEWAEYQLVYDTPDKMISEEEAVDGLITSPLIEHLESAENQLYIISPYFVPLSSGVEYLAQLHEKGIDITILTNSLAANNQFSVHSGYAPSRKPLLESGIKIYEVKPNAEVSGAEFFTASGATATLHTKAFLIDDREVFIGSFNFDPRSAFLNSEMGVLISSEELARRFEENTVATRQRNTYELFLNDENQLRWRGYDENGREVIYDREPETSWFKRFSVGLISLFPIKRQL